MAKDKKSFLLYCDLIHTVKKMPKNKAGELFLTILGYVNDENPEIEDPYVDLAFEPIKQQLKRDLVKYNKLREKNADNARKRWDAVASDGMRSHAKHADSVSDNDSDIDKESITSDFDSFWITYDKKNNKPKCLKKWLSLKQKDRDLIKEYIPAYVKSTPNKKYRKNPLTFLNNSAWLDELEETEDKKPHRMTTKLE